MAACGANVPVSYYPEWLEWLSRTLPVTNGLLAIRGVFDGAATGTILGDAALEAAVATGWMAAALASFNQLGSRGRRTARSTTAPRGPSARAVGSGAS